MLSSILEEIFMTGFKIACILFLLALGGIGAYIHGKNKKPKQQIIETSNSYLIINPTKDTIRKVDKSMWHIEQQENGIIKYYLKTK